MSNVNNVLEASYLCENESLLCIESIHRNAIDRAFLPLHMSYLISKDSRSRTRLLSRQCRSRGDYSITKQDVFGHTPVSLPMNTPVHAFGLWNRGQGAPRELQRGDRAVGALVCRGSGKVSRFAFYWTKIIHYNYKQVSLGKIEIQDETHVREMERTTSEEDDLIPFLGWTVIEHDWKLHSSRKLMPRLPQDRTLRRPRIVGKMERATRKKAESHCRHESGGQL